MEVATWMKLGILLQQLDPAEGVQQPSSDIGSGSWVWAFVMPTESCDQPLFVFHVLLFLIS